MAFNSIISISSMSLYFSFVIYLIAIIPFGLAVKSTKKGAIRLAITLTGIGFVAQLNYFILRWIVSGHAPVSNLYEFLTFFGMMLVGSFFVIFYIYRQAIIGLFLLPVSILIIAYASMFAKEVTPLIPALQSNWLTIHVLTVAIASAILSISFVTGLIYLIKKIDPNKKDKRVFFLEFILYLLVVVVGFIVITTAFRTIDYAVSYEYENKEGQIQYYDYHLPAIVVPANSNTVKPLDKTGYSYESADQYPGLIEIPINIEASKLNTIIWSFLTGTILYGLLRIVTRKKIAQLLRPLTNKVNLTLMDEISYRAILIGFPLFALGGLFFAMIWAHLAWGRFWGWDPKEVWALITFLFYTAFLHFRISKGWEGERTAWLAIIGFGTIVFNQVFVNLVIAGLHSYA
ncbi:c-type cytochrome biogenesis protein CcsB [Psychrobacillus sp. NPDC096389]|uniref:c-type cytochrome biogenesis protein CcsB n=1 Tax=Psychrobacillus sp. NPDC096389 TaxID=3364490 RepID=UPI0038096995